MTELKLRELRPGDELYVTQIAGGNGWNSDPTLWSTYLREQSAGTRVVVLAWWGQRPVGYGTLLWQSRNTAFRQADIPEINNLVIEAEVRRQGIGKRMIGYLEESALEAGKSAIGIGVGLYADYGPAQRLYIDLGFRPDGRGITYDNETVHPGSTVRVDDELVIWLTKPLCTAEAIFKSIKA
jgi:GNAT superfamily N-acetyltransferase